MGIKIKNKPKLAHTSEFELSLIDGDMIAFAVASASDGHIYRVINPDTHELLFEHRYKKDINAWFKENPEVLTDWLTDDFEPEDIKTAIHSCKQMITTILTDIGAKDYQIYLTGDDNFRYQVNPQYKANRKEQRKPYHLINMRQYLIDHWGATVVNGMEADDALGIAQDKDNINAIRKTVICSIDKDLKCVPGWHYSWAHHGKEPELSFVTKHQAKLNFWKQVLTGDRTDNIIGIHGVGEKKATAIVEGSKIQTDFGFYCLCMAVYMQHKNYVRAGFKSQFIWACNRVNKVAAQIWILQERKMWQPPKI